MLECWEHIAKETNEEYQRFIVACGNVQHTQLECLKDILSSNSDAEIGQRHGFASIKSVDEFRDCVPLCTYDDIAGDVGAQSRGENRLCAEPVRFFEETGGSTGGSKLVPFTDSALRSMHRGIEPWLANLIEQRPGLIGGAGYWSISPAARAERKTACGTPIGSESDLSFLREELQPAFAATLATPPEISTLRNLDDWRLLSLLSLAVHEDLRLISVWSPSFFTALIEALPLYFDRLQSLLRGSTLMDDISGPVSAALQDTEVRDRASRRLGDAFASGQLDTRKMWPNLDTISCWTHGPAAGLARELQDLFPTVHMQGKGLLATEGLVSIPLLPVEMPVLAIRSGFFEFIDENDRCWLAHEVKPGQSYKVVLTNWSGLYRYDLGDTILAHGHYLAAPTLEFVGRQGAVSDICGEKLSEAFVSRCLSSVKGFSVLAPADRGYRLIVDGKLFAADEAGQLAGRIEGDLADNPQYDYARKIGQLLPLRVVRVERPAELYVERKSHLGQNLGDIKPTALCLDADLATTFSRHSL